MLLDTDSISSLCIEQLAHVLHLSGDVQKLSLTIIEQSKSGIRVHAIKFNISNMDGSRCITLTRVFTIPELKINELNIAQQCDVEEWLSFEGAVLPDVDIQKVSILIGQDSPDALLQLEVRQTPGGSYACKQL